MHSAIRRLCPVSINTEFECEDNLEEERDGHVARWPSATLIPSREERRVPSRVERCASIYNTDVISHLAVTYRLRIPIRWRNHAVTRWKHTRSPFLSGNRYSSGATPRGIRVRPPPLSFERSRKKGVLTAPWKSKSSSFVLIYSRPFRAPRYVRMGVWNDTRGTIPSFLNDVRFDFW